MLANSETHGDGALRELLRAVILFFTLLLLSVITIRAQQLLIPTTDTLPPNARQSQSGNKEEEEFINPARPGVSNPAEFQKPGVLQIEYGYDASFRGRGFRLQQTAPLALRFAATSHLLFELDLDTVSSQTDQTRTRMTGIGDTRAGFQIVALKENEKHPALAFAYYAKLPTASAEKGLGTGRMDHKIVTLLSKKFGKTDLDFNAAYLIVGREQERGWVTGGQAALGLSREFKNNYGFEAELSGQTKDDAQPVGLYALGALTYKVNKRFVFDSGMRFGLTQDAPRVGVFAGMTVGVVDFYRKKL
jgi:hypothetical protein